MEYKLKDFIKYKTNHWQDLTKQTSCTKVIKLVLNDLFVNYPLILDMEDEEIDESISHDNNNLTIENFDVGEEEETIPSFLPNQNNNFNLEHFDLFDDESFDEFNHNNIFEEFNFLE